MTRGVRQGDPISPNLFSAGLESVTWHLASRLIQELVEMYGKVRLRMNTNKTKVMMRNNFSNRRAVNKTHTSVGYSTITTNWSRKLTKDAEQHGLRSTTSRTPQMPCLARESELNSSIPSFDGLSRIALKFGTSQRHLRKESE
uniref:Reverse transcriptase domain-containing protein n=1 Tax=Caenorhabditis japonica TaxID=281687 RepID=A0A8R1DXW0_CAEJA